jgi:putative flavoprotein involved in K+ transport
VLVVGSGQTGLQLAEELSAAGRPVYISVGSAGRVPRGYRGRDIFSWLVDIIERGAAAGWQHSQASASLAGPGLYGPHLVDMMNQHAGRRPRPATATTHGRAG